jgi:hypothetical protein
VVFLAAAGLVLWVLGPEVVQPWLALTGVGVAGLLGWAAKGIADWRSGSAATEASRLDPAAEDLAAAVRRTWAGEAVHRGLTSPLPIAVRMRSADSRIAAHPAQWAGSTGAAAGDETPAAVELSGTVTDAAELYGHITTGRMVIVGEPGGGKTSAAVLLMLALYDTERRDGRIPVLLPLASWDPVATPIERWMAGQLVTTYGVPPNVARGLVERGRILPILDGLDEVAEPLRSAALTGLRALTTAPLVLTCRTGEYAQAVTAGVLVGAAVVEMAPVDATAAAAYLTQSGTADTTRWEPVITALRLGTGNPCQQALRNPLMLSLARIVYQAPSADPAELTTYTTIAQVEDRLLDGLLPAVYGHEVTDTTAEQARRWMSFLARHLDVLGPGAIAWWRLPHCIPEWQQRVVAGLAYGAAALIWTAILTVAILWRWHSFAQYAAFALWNGLPVAITIGLAGAVTGAAVPMPARLRRPGRRQVAKGLKRAIPAGLVVGLATATISAATLSRIEPSDWVYLATPGLTGGLLAALAFGFTTSFSDQQRNAVTPLSTFRTDRKAALIVAVGGSAIVSTLMLALHGYDLFAIMIGAGVLWYGLRSCATVPYWVAVTLLARRGVLPRRPLQFLESAYRRGVLRQTGMVYEFRHARLAERLRAIP